MTFNSGALNSQMNVSTLIWEKKDENEYDKGRGVEMFVGWERDFRRN